MWHELFTAVQKSQALLDKRIAEWMVGYASSGKTLFCRSGCQNCCSLFVHTTLAEATAIAAILSPEQAAALDCYITRQHQALQDVTDLKTCLARHRNVIGPCPFLDATGKCGIYRQRPLSCRALLSTRPKEWCAVDFSELSSLDKQLYLASLDREVVNFPVHYVAATQEFASHLELELMHAMFRGFGVALTGNLPFLVHLERTMCINATLTRGFDATMNELLRYPFFHPLLIKCTAKWPDGCRIE